MNNRTPRLSEKVALVTGASLGIGRACAKMLAAEGAAVAVTDILGDEGRKVVEEICDRGGTAAYYSLDVADEGEVAAVTAQIMGKFGVITVLVNNAGITGADKPTHEMTSEEWDHLMNINVKGVFFCTKHVLPQMMATTRGSIINLSSIYGLVGAPDIPAYHASKGAVRMMTKTDALLYAKYGIRVNSVHPGFIWTPMVEGFLDGQPNPAAAKQALGDLHPLGHMGDVDDVAYGVVYLASDEAKFVTGSELVIDGGYTAR